MKKVYLFCLLTALILLAVPSCPFPVNKDTQQIGSEGGKLELKSGTVLEIPAGAFSESASITVTLEESNETFPQEAMQTGEIVVSSMIKIFADYTAFVEEDSHVTLKIPVDRSRIPDTQKNNEHVYIVSEIKKQSSDNAEKFVYYLPTFGIFNIDDSILEIRMIGLPSEITLVAVTSDIYQIYEGEKTNGSIGEENECSNNNWPTLDWRLIVDWSIFLEDEEYHKRCRDVINRLREASFYYCNGSYPHPMLNPSLDNKYYEAIYGKFGYKGLFGAPEL